MGKMVFAIEIDVDDLDPYSRCYYDFVDWPIDSRASTEEIDAALTEIYDQMTAPDREFGTAFKSWFYNKRPKAYDMMCDLLWNTVDEYVQDELTKRFKKD